MSDSGKISVLDGGVSAGFNQWIQAQRQRGKSDKDILLYVMKIWLDFAWSKVPKSDKAKIKAGLMQSSIYGPRRKPKPGRRSAVQNEYGGTVAERVALAINYKNIRALSGAARFRAVRSFVNARQFAAKHHAAGFYAAYDFVHKRAMDGTGPHYRRYPSGSAEGKFLDGLAEVMVENFAGAAAVPGRPAPLGIAGLAGEAFESSMTEVAEMFARFVREDSVKQGMAAGFTVVNFA